MGQIIDHNYWRYRNRWQASGDNRWNGAFFYSKEIVKNIIPNVKTDRNWITINTKDYALDHSIVFIHNNLHPARYEWLKNYNDLILVCGIRETMPKVSHLGKAIYLPLSVDVEDVKKYKTEKTKDCAFAGRKSKAKGAILPSNCDMLCGLSRTKMLAEMAKYRKIYAVGRTAIEARILGCQIGIYDKRFRSAKRWKIIDNKEAAEILQKELDKIDGKDNSTQ